MKYQFWIALPFALIVSLIVCIIISFTLCLLVYFLLVENPLMPFLPAFMIGVKYLPYPVILLALFGNISCYFSQKKIYSECAIDHEKINSRSDCSINFTIPLPISEAFQLCLRSLDSLPDGVFQKSYNLQSGSIEVKTNKRKGSKSRLLVSFQFILKDPNTTKIELISRVNSPLRVYDMGMNLQNIQAVMNYLKQNTNVIF